MHDQQRILGVVAEPPSAVGYVRFFQPFEHLVDRGYRLATLGQELTLTRGPSGYAPDPSILNGVRAVVFPQMVASPTLPDGSRVDLVNALCSSASRRGLPVIYSVDDYLPELDPANPSFEKIRDSRQNLETILAHADAIFVTTPTLAESFASQGKPRYLLPNAIDPKRWSRRPQTSGELRIGWAGSSSHVADLLMVLPAIRRLQRRVDFRFFVLGLTDLPIKKQVAQIRPVFRELEPGKRELAESFLELAALLREIRHVHRPFVSLDDYLRTLPQLDLDLGICPLIDNPFNRCKSALKFYEYAACGTMTVASDVVPYRDEVGVTTANDAAAWCDLLESYAREPSLCEERLREQREFVLTQRNIESLRDGWADALDEVLAARGVVDAV